MSSADARARHAAAPSLPDAFRLGAVHLTVTDLERSVAFYENPLGLRVQRRDGDTAALGAGGDDLLVLTERPGARRAGRHAGLFHLALLFESREELAHAVLRLLATRTQITGASDHGVSEAIYLHDPDGNGIELYADRPRKVWPPPQSAGDRIGIYTIALDVESLLGSVEARQPRPQAGRGLAMGHVHLHVNAIAAARRFYVETVGFESMTDLGSAAFLAAGGYHHHLGINVWQGEGIPPAPDPDEVVGLRRWTAVVPEVGDLDAVRSRLTAAGEPAEDAAASLVVRDPAGNALVMTSSG